MTTTDSELGRSLLTERGMQWLHAHGGDPYAMLLRAEEADRGGLARRITELGPLHRSRTGAWVTGDSGLAAEILADARLVSRALAGLPHGHALGRCAAFPALSAGAVRRLRAMPALNPDDTTARQVAESVLDRLGDRLGDRFDLVADLARPVAVGLAAQRFAVPPERHDEFGALCLPAGIAMDAVLCPPRLRPALALIGAVNGLRELLGECAGHDSDLAAAATLLSVVGIDMAVNLAANTMRALLDAPGRWRALCAEPDLARAAVDETLRHDPPVRLESRVAREDVDLAGVRIAAGDEVAVHIEAANQPGPRQESPARPVSLLDGPPFALLAPFVHAASAAVLRGLASRLPTLRADGPPVGRPRAPVTHAIVRFPVAA